MNGNGFRKHLLMSTALVGAVLTFGYCRNARAQVSMPHSPRIHNGELWLLNSGTGELGVVKRDKKGGRFEPRIFCPGFLRGLAFHGDMAFVGLSKPRYKRFDGLALADRLKEVDSEPWCGVQILSLSTGTCLDWLRIDGKIAELYDLEVLHGVACPMAVAPHSSEAAQLISYEGKEQMAAADTQRKGAA